MSGTKENEDPIPWPIRNRAVRIPVSALTASIHLGGLEPNARRAINVRFDVNFHKLLNPTER